jgi:hypothetical protein
MFYIIIIGFIEMLNVTSSTQGGCHAITLTVSHRKLMHVAMVPRLYPIDNINNVELLIKPIMGFIALYCTNRGTERQKILEPGGAKPN